MCIPLIPKQLHVLKCYYLSSILLSGFIFSSRSTYKNRSTVFTLGNRDTVLTTELEDPIIVIPQAQKTEKKVNSEHPCIYCCSIVTLSFSLFILLLFHLLLHLSVYLSISLFFSLYFSFLCFLFSIPMSHCFVAVTLPSLTMDHESSCLCSSSLILLSQLLRNTLTKYLERRCNTCW